MAASFTIGSGIANYIAAIRVDVADDDSSDYKYTDAQLKDIVVKSLREINLIIGTAFLYYPTPSGIAPLPTDSQAALIVALSECYVARRARSAAVRKGIRVRSGEEEIDTTAAFSGHDSIVKEDCDRFNRLLVEYLDKTDGAADNGKLIWHGEQRQYEDETHDGQASHTRWYDSIFDP